MLSNYLQLAVQAAIEASKEILSVYHSDNFVVEAKEDKSPLTKADKVAHKIITSFLKKSTREESHLKTKLFNQSNL